MISDLVLPSGGAPGQVGRGWLVLADADGNGSVEGGVGLPVASAVEAVPTRHARGGADRANHAQPILSADHPQLDWEAELAIAVGRRESDRP